MVVSKTFETTNKLFNLNKKLMEYHLLLPKKGKSESKLLRFLKDISIAFVLILGIFAVATDFFIQILYGFDDILDITENFAALAPLSGAIYMIVCFIINRKKIIPIIDEMSQFEEFSGSELLLQVDEKSTFYTKMFFIYGFIGNFFYLLIPYTHLDECREKRARSQYNQNMPCAVITRCRLPFEYTHSVFKYILGVGFQLFCCIATTTTVLAITMFIVSFLMQIIAQLKNLQKHIRHDTPLRFCARHHIAIIEYTKSVTDAFSMKLLIYITICTFQISILGFEVLMSNNFGDSIRFGFHLLGWLVLLFLTCSYGQELIDESVKIAKELYFIKWYEKPVEEQKTIKLMILRSQKPLVLSAASLGTFSYETFLNVLKTAYSYFTLIINVKED